MKLRVSVIAICSLLFFGLACAQNDSVAVNSNGVNLYYKFYPLNMAGGQMPLYTADFKGGIELVVKRRHGFEFIAGGTLPNPFTAIIQFAVSNCPYCSSPYWLFGGRGIFIYKYYFLEGRGKNDPGPFVGLYFSGSRYLSTLRYERDEPKGIYWEWATRSRSHFVMVNCAVLLGYRFSIKNMSLEFSGHYGYRYDYFWRNYVDARAGGTVEYDVHGDKMYHYYKKVPMGGGVNVTVGGIIKQKKSPPNRQGF